MHTGLSKVLDKSVGGGDGGDGVGGVGVGGVGGVGGMEMTGGIGTPTHMAPELITRDQGQLNGKGCNTHI
jgi:hypothetical protein